MILVAGIQQANVGAPRHLTSRRQRLEQHRQALHSPSTKTDAYSNSGGWRCTAGLRLSSHSPWQTHCGMVQMLCCMTAALPLPLSNTYNCQLPTTEQLASDDRRAVTCRGDASGLAKQACRTAQQVAPFAPLALDFATCSLLLSSAHSDNSRPAAVDLSAGRVVLESRTSRHTAATPAPSTSSPRPQLLWYCRSSPASCCRCFFVQQGEHCVEGVTKEWAGRKCARFICNPRQHELPLLPHPRQRSRAGLPTCCQLHHIILDWACGCCIAHSVRQQLLALGHSCRAWRCCCRRRGRHVEVQCVVEELM